MEKHRITDSIFERTQCATNNTLINDADVHCYDIEDLIGIKLYE